jgi:hypothetical protein
MLKAEKIDSSPVLYSGPLSASSLEVDRFLDDILPENDGVIK